jgi:MFS family permease
MYGLSAFQTGLVFVPMMVIVGFLTPYSARIAERFGVRRVVATGLILMAAGLALLAIDTSAAAPPGGLDVVESRHDSENGDFICYVPWGNLGFYYNAAGIEFDNNVVRIGRYEATPEQLVELEGNVSISIAD